mmetsp:Transcript_14177/g.59977  ORF Transcript_14177/g.59977 Transcript_14177/m.59977 type:complete len:271 (-) Transcript_14177:781-1593(-)
MDVRVRRAREIVVYHRAHADKVHPPRHQVGGDEDPGVARAESVNLRSSLRVRHRRVYETQVQAVAGELLRELLRAILRLDEDDDRGLDPLVDELSKREELAALLPAKHQPLRDGAARAVALANGEADRLGHDASREVLNGFWKCRGEQSAGDIRPVARRHRRVHLLDEAHLEELIRLVEHQVPHGAEAHLVLLDEGFQPERGGDEDVHLGELVVLRRLGEQTRSESVGPAAQQLEDPERLLRELLRGREQQRPRSPRIVVLGREFGHHRE